MTREDGGLLWDRWIDLWNGHLEQAPNIIHPSSPSIGSRPRESPIR
jgi:hypothetical protein